MMTNFRAREYCTEVVPDDLGAALPNWGMAI